MVNVRLEQFEGPLDLLLQLIEQNRLDISNVSLSTVTEQYLGRLERLERLHPDELADFLVVAAKLLLIKSRLLLPQLQIPDEDGMSLEDQLRLYQTFVGATENIRRLFRKRRVMFGRDHAELFEPMFAPPQHLQTMTLKGIFEQVLQKLEPLVAIPERTIARAISLQEKIHAIRMLINSKASIRFDELLEAATSRMDIIVTFLALLELVKQRTAAVVQDGNFTDIRIDALALSSKNQMGVTEVA